MLVFFLRESIVCYNFLRNNERREGRKNEEGDGDVGYLCKKAGKKIKIKIKMDTAHEIYIFGN